MPITLGQLSANRKSVTVTFEGGDELHVEYYPQRFTAQMLANVSVMDTDAAATLTAQRAVEMVSSVTDMLLVLLASWDLVESIGEDGTPGPTLPITREALAGVGLPIQWAILGAITSGAASSQGEASAPGASVSARRSGATSSPTAS